MTYPPQITMPYYELDVNFNENGGSTTVYVTGSGGDVAALVTAVYDAITGMPFVSSLVSNSWGETQLDSYSYTIPSVVASPSLPATINTTPGGSTQLDIALSGAPVGDLTVNVIISPYGNGQPDVSSSVTASPSSLTFTAENWNTAQQVTLDVTNPANAQNEAYYVDVAFVVSGESAGISTTLTWNF
jgi:hypothetical protein